MNSQKTQEGKNKGLASDTAVPTQMQTESCVRKAKTDRRPGENEDVPGLEPQQRREPTTSQNKGDIEQEKNRSQGEVHKLDSKSIPPGRTNGNAELTQQSPRKKRDIRQDKNRDRERAEDHHRSDSDSVVHGHLNPNVEKEATTSQYEQDKKQKKDRLKGVHRLLSKFIPSGHTNENAELMQQPQKEKSDIRQEKNRDGERAGDRYRSDSDSVVHGHLNPNVEKETTTNQSVQAKKQEKDRCKGEVHRLGSKSITPGRTNENAEKRDIRQEYNRDGERVGDYHRSDSKSLVEDEATTSWSVQAKEQEEDEGEDHRSDSKLDPSKHIYEDVHDYHKAESEPVSPKPPNEAPGEQRSQTVTDMKNRKTGLKGDKGRYNVTLVLLGQSGSGKSASGNTILGKEVFESCISSVPVTTQCETVETQMFGIHLTVVDTPDLFSDDLKEHDKALEDCKSIIQATTDHKYLLVMQLGRFTDGEREILPQIKAKFGKEVVQNVIILFTHAKELNGKTLEEYVHKTDTNLQDVIKECGSRYCAFENTVKNPKQVSGLIDIICEMEGMTRKKAENKDCSIL